MMPAPTVSLVRMTMNAPNLLFSRYGANGTDLSKLTITVAISFKPKVLAARYAPVLISRRCLMCVITTLADLVWIRAVVLEDEVYASRGDVIAAASHPVESADQFEVDLFLDE